MKGDFKHGAYKNDAQARNDPDCAYVMGGGVNPTGLRSSPKHCMDFAEWEYNAKGSLEWYRPQGNLDIQHGMWCSTCCQCSDSEILYPSALTPSLEAVADGGRFVWVTGADGLHENMNPTCSRGWVEEVAQTMHNYMKSIPQSRNIKMYMFMYGTPVGYTPLKLKFAPEWCTDEQSPENILIYNENQRAFLAELKAKFGDLIHGWILLNPQGAVNAAHDIWDKLGWGPNRHGTDVPKNQSGGAWGADGAFLGQHFGSNDGTHAPHMANKANFNLFLNMLSDVVDTTE